MVFLIFVAATACMASGGPFRISFWAMALAVILGRLPDESSPDCGYLPHIRSCGVWVMNARIEMKEISVYTMTCVHSDE
jgi:hypothetical protein